MRCTTRDGFLRISEKIELFPRTATLEATAFLLEIPQYILCKLLLPET